VERKGIKKTDQKERGEMKEKIIFGFHVISKAVIVRRALFNESVVKILS
jgi:hypothetical protein